MGLVLQAGTQTPGKDGWELLPTGPPSFPWEEAPSPPGERGQEVRARHLRSPSLHPLWAHLSLSSGCRRGGWVSGLSRGPPHLCWPPILRTCSSLTCGNFSWFVCPHPELQKTGKDQGPRGLVITHPVPASTTLDPACIRLSRLSDSWSVASPSQGNQKLSSAANITRVTEWQS